jgi:hypothetical protein
VLERLLLPQLSAAFIAADFQHDFRPRHSTTTALLPLATHIAVGFNQRYPIHRTVSVAIDISKAFDSVNRYHLLTALNNSTLHHNTTRWLTTYLRGRAASCRYQGSSSRFRAIHEGVPQGSVISPILFNLFVSDCPDDVQLLTSYADDFTAAVSHPSYQEAATQISDYLSDIHTWAEAKDLAIAPAKSQATLFTSATHQSRKDPEVTINLAPVELVKTPKILGVTFDTHLTFAPHAASIITRATDRLKVMKALSGTSWGHQKETQMLTFKSLIRPVISYACPVWFPNLAQGHVDRLQVVQNKALRIATGAHVMSHIDHLHSETEVLPVGEHLSMLCSQYLANTLRPHHPSHATVNTPPGPRDQKWSRFLPRVAPFLLGGVMPEDTYRPSIKALHTSSVREYLDGRRQNKVLDSHPPPVDPSELELDRTTRATLSQLRSGYCRRLLDYQKRIGKAPSDRCPECGRAQHTVEHLFKCRSHPTDLRPVDLWARPREVADYLTTTPSFSDLSLGPPRGPHRNHHLRRRKQEEEVRRKQQQQQQQQFT